jgi:hypothetical protein
MYAVGCPTRVYGQIAGTPVVVDTVAATTFTKAYKGDITGNINRVFMAHQLTANLLLRDGWRLGGRLGMNESFYRLQDRRDEAKNAGINLSKQFGPRLNLDGTLSDSRFFNRAVTFSGDVQNFKNDLQRADARVGYLRTFANGLQLNGRAVTGVTRSEQTFLRDQNQEGSLAGGLGYTLGRITVTGNGFVRRTAGFARAGGLTHRGLGLVEDSLGTVINYRVSANTSINAYYHRFALTNEFMDLPRGVFLEQQFNENLVREIEARTAEILRVNAVANPNGRVQLSVGAEHSETTSQFGRAEKRNSRTVTDGVRAVLVYNLRKGTVLRINLSSNEILHDLGENSLGTNTDKRQRIRASLDYPVTGTLDLRLGVGTSLIQSFYRDFDVNPRDRDQLDQNINLRIDSQPFPKITARILLSTIQTDFVNISGSLSQNNRRETTYDFRPELVYKITERIELSQKYGLNIEFTEFDFTENDNFLDRNFLFTNTIKTQLTPKLRVWVDYSLLLHDRGSYLAPTPGEERLLRIEQEDRRDRMSLSFRYQINPRLAVFGGHDYTQRKDVFAGGAGRPAFKDGGLEVGAEGNYAWGGGRTLRFKVAKHNRFGRFSSAAQEEYWVMNSTLRFPF